MFQIYKSKCETFLPTIFPPSKKIINLCALQMKKSSMESVVTAHKHFKAENIDSTTTPRPAAVGKDIVALCYIPNVKSSGKV